MDVQAFRDLAETLAQETITLRRDFHQYPELGFQEHRTAKIVTDILTNLEVMVRSNVAETGVVALLDNNHPAPCVLVRFDMDALPIHEESHHSFRSKHPGVMHACGHDGHIAIGLTLAKLLASLRDKLPGQVKFVFQPAEEGLGGAERMVRAGVLEDPKPNYCLAMHLWNFKPIGWIGLRSGAIMAGADKIQINIAGKGGHGASPHLTSDPVLAAAQIITALQSVVARNLDPQQSAVVSITQFHAGEAFNVIPSKARLEGTIRTFEPEVRDLIHRRIMEISTGVADSLGCKAEVHIEQLTPPVVNDPEVTSIVKTLAEKIFPEFTVDSHEAFMVSEDMAFFMQDVPGCYFLIGSSNAASGQDAPHHNPLFDFDESVLSYAVTLLSAAVWTLLSGA